MSRLFPEFFIISAILKYMLDYKLFRYTILFYCQLVTVVMERSFANTDRLHCVSLMSTQTMLPGSKRKCDKKKKVIIIADTMKSAYRSNSTRRAHPPSLKKTLFYRFSVPAGNWLHGTRARGF